MLVEIGPTKEIIKLVDEHLVVRYKDMHHPQKQHRLVVAKEALWPLLTTGTINAGLAGQEIVGDLIDIKVRASNPRLAMPCHSVTIFFFQGAQRQVRTFVELVVPNSGTPELTVGHRRVARQWGERLKWWTGKERLCSTTPDEETMVKFEQILKRAYDPVLKELWEQRGFLSW